MLIDVATIHDYPASGVFASQTLEADLDEEAAANGTVPWRWPEMRKKIGCYN